MKTIYCLILTAFLIVASPVLAEDELVSEPDEIFAEFPFVDEWESFSISDEESDRIGGVDDAAMIVFEDRDGSGSSLPSRGDGASAQAGQGTQCTGRGQPGSASFRFGALDEVGRWQEKGDAASLESALDLLLSAVEFDPTQAVYWSLLGWVHAAGATDPLMDALAERALLTALDIEPKAPPRPSDPGSPLSWPRRNRPRLDPSSRASCVGFDRFFSRGAGVDRPSLRRKWACGQGCGISWFLEISGQS